MSRHPDKPPLGCHLTTSSASAGIADLSGHCATTVRLRKVRGPSALAPNAPPCNTQAKSVYAATLDHDWRWAGGGGCKVKAFLLACANAFEKPGTSRHVR